MHFVSDVRVCGVHCVMPNGTPTAGMVLAFFSEPNSLCLSAAVVVDGAVPEKGCTYCTRSWLCRLSAKLVARIYKSNFCIQKIVVSKCKKNSRLESPEGQYLLLHDYEKKVVRKKRLRILVILDFENALVIQ